jgi:hypothetical protein
MLIYFYFILKELSIMKLFLQNKALVNILLKVLGILTVGIPPVDQICYQTTGFYITTEGFLTQHF